MKVAGFFSGVGGIELGFEKVAFNVIYSNEIDKNAAKTFLKNNNSKLVVDDIHNVKSVDIPDTDIIVGGFPCQAFSIAGYRKGFEDERGEIFFQLARIIKDKKPRVIFIENVKNLATHDKGNTFKVIKETLESYGYQLKKAEGIIESYNKSKEDSVTELKKSQEDFSKIADQEIISIKKTYARGLIKNIIKASPERIDSHKFTFEDFYGCDFAMLKYESQLKYKRLMVEEVMRKIAGLPNIEISDVLASEDIYNYRNKIIEPFSVYGNKIITGFFKRKSHEVFEVDENILNSKLGNRIIKELKEILNKNKISVYNEITHKGLLRNVMIRTNSNNEAMLVLIINSNKITENIKNLLFKLREKIEEIKSIYISLNSKKTNTVIGEKNIFIYGEESIKENLNGIEFHISPTSFFQINVKQAKRLYDIAISFFDDIDNKYVVDAYSGTGTIGMIMANIIALMGIHVNKYFLTYLMKV